jgi:quinone-modifying oxidoreductase subunit QmoC
MAESFEIKSDAGFIRDVMRSGGEDFKKCFQCAACTSVCSLSTQENPFPRRQMLLAQWGLKDKLMEDAGPWLCFYCGDCTKVCPRQAYPGETMMALRRLLTAEYDWTGLSSLMYRSAFWEFGILGLVSALVVMLFTLPHSFGFGLLSRSGSEAMSTVMLNRFAPVEVVHIADRALAALLAILLLLNASRMFARITRGSNIPARTYFSQLPFLILQGVTQKRWRDCNSEESHTNWGRHLFLVGGYATMFTLVVVFLPWFQVEDSSFHLTSILGYAATVALMVSTAWIIADRILKRTEMHRFSELTDWMFPILLFLTALSGISLNLLRLMNLPMPTYVMYVTHMAIAVPMLVVEVPFGKWAHLLYRPLAIYVAAVKSRASEFSTEQAAAANQAIA